ncbi:hypothetical protein HU200_056641 [Digitaria exilis]|uniref:Uncharacterized protein n=1 Tax=Digitaria exilis TaxID=1010633 RepID=A0A835ALQ2_9POAL|nr:hypothetical protein HU200_056641 [Digitaria exilis]
MTSSSAGGAPSCSSSSSSRFPRCSVLARRSPSSWNPRRLLPVPAVHEQSAGLVEEKVVAAHPWSVDRRTRRSCSSSAFMDAVSKHQVPSGANPDSN